MNPLASFIESVQRQILEPIVTLMALAAFLVFLWGVVEFLRAGASGGKEKEDGRRHMVWGIIGLAIIFGANAIVSILGDTANTLLP
jgi:hypothetical protein